MRASHLAVRTLAIMLLALAAFEPTTFELAAQASVTVPPPGEDVYEIRLADGSTLFARISSSEGDAIVLITTGGARVEIERSQIASLEPAEGQVVGTEFWREDPNVSRLFFSSTGRGLERGRAYFGTYLIVLPFVAVGVTDWFMIGGGAPITLGEFQPFYIAPKIQIVRAERVALSVGAIHFSLNEDFDDTDVGVAYGVGTFGTRDNAFTAGLGFGYAGSDFESQPVAIIGGEVRAGRRVKLLTENYFLPGETGAVFSFGLRFIGERLSADIGIGGAAGGGDVGCCIPLVNVSYVFGGI
jgi:hypothetical protein